MKIIFTSPVFLLVDIRHEPSANDKQMYEWIVYQGYDPIIIATKLDKIKRSQVAKHIKMMKEGLHAKPQTIVLPYSAQTKQGREEIWNLLDGLLEIEEAAPDPSQGNIQGGSHEKK